LHCMHGWLGPRTGPRPPQQAPDVNYGASPHTARDPSIWSATGLPISADCRIHINSIWRAGHVPDDADAVFSRASRPRQWSRGRRSDDLVRSHRAVRLGAAAVPADRRAGPTAAAGLTWAVSR
jgi:hypothetical protein